MYEEVCFLESVNISVIGGVTSNTGGVGPNYSYVLFYFVRNKIIHSFYSFTSPI